MAKRKPTMSVAERNRFARQHEKLVQKIAHKFALQCREPWEDLFQLGCIGLLKAVERFDPTLGNAFSSFAVPYIQGEIQHFLRDGWESIKVPRRDVETVAKVRRLKRKLEALGATIDESSVARSLQLDKEKWQRLTQSVSGSLTVPLNEVVYAESASQAAVYGDDRVRLPRERLYKELYSLNSLACAMIQEAFFAGMSVQIIAKRHSTTEKEVREILQQGLAAISLNIKPK